MLGTTTSAVVTVWQGTGSSPVEEQALTVPSDTVEISGSKFNMLATSVPCERIFFFSKAAVFSVNCDLDLSSQHAEKLFLNSNLYLLKHA
jgi:hypothetical protein